MKTIIFAISGTNFVFTTNERDVKKAELKYDAFDKTVYENNASDVKYRFSSKEWDANAQLYYYGFRWYDPEQGIWTTKDPIGLSAGDLNVYRMVNNNPVGFVDSFGQFPVIATLMVIAVVVYYWPENPPANPWMDPNEPSQSTDPLPTVEEVEEQEIQEIKDAIERASKYINFNCSAYPINYDPLNNNLTI